MAFALRLLRWTPETFWRATPRELMAATHGLGASATPAGLGDLARLMEAFPDTASASPIRKETPNG